MGVYRMTTGTVETGRQRGRDLGQLEREHLPFFCLPKYKKPKPLFIHM